MAEHALALDPMARQEVLAVQGKQIERIEYRMPTAAQAIRISRPALFRGSSRESSRLGPRYKLDTRVAEVIAGWRGFASRQGGSYAQTGISQLDRRRPASLRQIWSEFRRNR